jgi:hypothetical protein
MGSALWEKYFTFSLGGSQTKALEDAGGGLSSLHLHSFKSLKKW